VLIPTTGFYGRKQAKLALDMGHTRFASVSDSRNDPYCSTFMEGVLSEIGKVPSTSIEEITYVTQADVSYSEIIEPLETERFEAVFLCASPLDTAMLAQNLKRHAKEIDLFSTSWGISTELVQTGGSAVEGLYFFQSIDSADPSERFSRFRESFRNRFDRDPSYVAIFNYEAVQALAECLAQDQSASPEKVKEFMLKKEGHRGVQSSFKFDGEGDVIRPLILHTVQTGSFIKVQ
jgi:branched-chain amino acid transport system substrate-binding protein